MIKKIIGLVISQLFINELNSQDILCYISEKDSILIIEKEHLTKKLKYKRNKVSFKSNSSIKKQNPAENFYTSITNYLNSNIDINKMPKINCTFNIGIILSKNGEITFCGLFNSFSKTADLEIINKVMNFKLSSPNIDSCKSYISFPYNYKIEE